MVPLTTPYYPLQTGSGGAYVVQELDTMEAGGTAECELVPWIGESERLRFSRSVDAFWTLDCQRSPRNSGHVGCIEQTRSHQFIQPPRLTTGYSKLQTTEGLPIGNLTSQFFANVYLNELDQFVKHQLKARWYVRYVDDFVLLHPDPAQLLAWRKQIEDFLQQQLSLKLKNLAAPHPLQQGTDFLGYVTRPFYRLARRRVVKRLQSCWRAFARQQVRPHALDLPPGATEQLRAQLSSLTAVWLAQPSAHSPFLFTPLA